MPSIGRIGEHCRCDQRGISRGVRSTDLVPRRGYHPHTYLGNFTGFGKNESTRRRRGCAFLCDKCDTATKYLYLVPPPRVSLVAVQSRWTIRSRSPQNISHPPTPFTHSRKYNTRPMRVPVYLSSQRLSLLVLHARPLAAWTTCRICPRSYKKPL